MFWKRKWKMKSEAELGEKWRELPLEKGDLPAMILAALLVLLPAVLLVGGIFTLVIWLLFLR